MAGTINKIEIDGNTYGLEDATARGKAVQPDWNQNDESAPDYVKNRPFYTGDLAEIVIIPATTVAFSKYEDSEQMAAAWPESFDLVAGKTYKISWDGTDYICTGVLFNNIPLLGNLGIAGAGENTGEPFLFLNQGQWLVGSTESATEHVIGIKTIDTPIVTLNEKYLPKASVDGYGVVKKSDIVSAYNFPINALHDQMVDAIAALRTGNASIVWGGEEVIGASYDSSSDMIYVIFSKDPLTTFIFSNNNGFYLSTVASGRIYGELQGNKVRITNDHGVYTVLSVDGDQSYKTLHVMAEKISFNGAPYGISATEIILRSSTEGSRKYFKITVDDTGTISATEV